MAYATHLTIATGDRIRLRFPQDTGHGEDEQRDNVRQDEGEISQEVQVSITYALDGEETDLAAIAAEKADEVRSAHEAAWHQIGAFSRRCHPPQSSVSSRCSAAGKQEVLRDDRQDAPRNDRQETLSVSGRQRPEQNGPQGNVHPAPLASPPISPPPIAPSRHRAPAKSAARYVPAQEYRGAREHHRDDPEAQPDIPQSSENGGHDAASPVLQPISQPQKILIRSLAPRIGLTPANLEEMLWSQYQQRQLGQLTQRQAKAVIQALELCGRSSLIAAEE